MLRIIQMKINIQLLLKQSKIFVIGYLVYLIFIKLKMQPKLQAPGMDLEQSQDYDQIQLQNFLNPRKSKSDELFGNLIIKNSQMQMRPSLIFNPPKPVQKGKQVQGVSVFRKKSPKPKKPKLCDYRKNICGYITKKIIRQFVGPTFQQMVQLLCQKNHCTYADCRTYYLSQIEHITGPTHVANLLITSKNNKQKKMKAVFREFFDWFLKERYVRYLLVDGKMTDKQAYIEYKNIFLLPLLSQNQQQAQNIIKEEQQMEALTLVLKKKSKQKSISAKSKSKSN